MLSQLHYDHLAFLCWALFLSTVVGSVLSLTALLFHKAFRKKTVRYALFLTCQLSFIPFLILTLLIAKPFTALNLDDVEKGKEIRSETTTLPRDQNELIMIEQSAPVKSPMAVPLGKDTLEVDAISTVEDSTTPKLLKDQLRDVTQKYAPVFVICWLIGVLIFLLRLIFSAIGLRRLKKSASPASSELNDLFQTVKKGIYEKQVILLESVKVTTPMVVSWVKPAILLPVGLMNNLSSEQLEAILIHELHHIRRHDFLWNILQRVAETLFFFNPLIWILGKEIRQLREELCDQDVIEQTQDPTPYAQALFSLTESSRHALALSAKSESGLARRFRSILSPQQLSNPISKLNSIVELCVILLIAACCLLPVVAKLNEDIKAESLPEFVEHDSPRGRILDPQGNPVSGARVILHYAEEGLAKASDSIVEEVITGADGSYRFNSPLKFREMGSRTWERNYAIFATHPDWAVGWHFLPPPNIFGDTSNPNPETLNLHLESPVTQDFEVKLFGKKDAEGKELDPIPLKGAKVYLFGFYPHDKSKRPDFLPKDYDPGKFFTYVGDLGLTNAVTDENGKCTITNLPTSMCSFMIKHPDTSQALKTRSFHRKKNWVTKCFPRSSVSGVLKDEEGNPLPNILIRAKSIDSWYKWYCRTDAQGRYEFPALHGKGHNSQKGGGGDGVFTFELLKTDWMIASELSCHLDPDEHIKDFNITATKGIPFYVTVMQKDGKPYPYARVSVENGKDSEVKHTDSKGRITFQVKPGKLTSRAMPNKDSYWVNDYFNLPNLTHSELHISHSRSEAKQMFIVDPKPLRAITGKLQFEGSNRSFNGEVRLKPLGLDGNYLSTSSSLGSGSKPIRATNSNFEADIPSGISYLAVAYSKDLQWVGSAEVSPEAKSVTITLKKSATQKLVLAGKDGKPMKNTSIQWGTYYEGEKLFISKVKTNNKGELTLPCLDPEKSYYVEYYKGREHALKKVTINPLEVIQLSFNGTKAIPVFDQKNQQLEISEILKVLPIKDGVGRVKMKPSIDSRTGKVLVPEQDYDEWIDQRYDRIKGLFKTASGDIIQCNAAVDFPITFRVISNLSEEFKRPYITSLDKTSQDTGDTFRALIVNQKGEPLEGVKCLTRFDFYNYHLHDKYDSSEAYENMLQEKTRFAEKLNGKESFVSDAEGMIYIENGAQKVCVKLTAPGYASRWIVKDSIQKSPIKITMLNNTSCRGVLKGSDGQPLAFHPIVFETTRSYLEEGWPIRRITPLRVLMLTDSEGRFNQLLEAGKWKLKAAISDDLVVNQEFFLVEGEQLDLVPKLSAAAHLTLIYKNQSDKNPIPGLNANLSVNTGPFSSGPALLNSKLTDAEGSVMFKGLIPDSSEGNIRGSHRVNFYSTTNAYTAAYFADKPIGISNSGDLFNLPVKLTVGENTAEIHLATGTMISGKVTTSIDTDLSSLHVSYLSNQRLSNYMGIRVSKDGSFSGYLPDVNGRQLRVVAYQLKNSKDKTLAPAFSDSFVGGAGKNYTFDLHLTSGGSFKGKLIDGEGKPIFGAHIQFDHLSNMEEPGGMAWADTDNEGRFMIHGVAPGEIKLKVWKDNKSLMVDGEQQVITIAEGEMNDLGEVQVKKR